MLQNKLLLATKVSKIILLLSLVLIVLACRNQEYSKEDWPQFMGPDRDGTWHLDVEKDTLLPGDLAKLWEISMKEYLVLMQKQERLCGPFPMNASIMWVIQPDPELPLPLIRIGRTPWARWGSCTVLIRRPEK